MNVEASTVRVIAERKSADGRVTWQARISTDRERLEVVAIVAPSATPTIVQLLSEAELRELLAPKRDEPWVCQECGTPNAPASCWCRQCSNHLSGVAQ